MGQLNGEALNHSFSSRSFKMVVTAEGLRPVLEERGVACRDIIRQFTRLESAKQVAFEQASIVLKEKLDTTVAQLTRVAEKMQRQLTDKHEADVAEIRTIRYRVGESLATLEAALRDCERLERARSSSDDSGYCEIRDVDIDGGGNAAADADEQNEDRRNNNSGDTAVEGGTRRTPSLEEVRETLAALSRELPGSIWTYRSVHRFVPCAPLPELKLGVFQECFLGEDYTTVTRYCYGSDETTEVTGAGGGGGGKKGDRHLNGLRGAEGRSRGHSFTGQVPEGAAHYKEGKLRRAKSDLALKRGMSIYPISLDTFRPYAHTATLRHRLTASHTGEPIRPVGAAFLPNNNVIIADALTGHLDVFSHEDGAPAQRITAPALRPEGLGITRDGYVIVADGAARNLKAFTRGGEAVCKFGTGYFANPTALAVDSRDNYVVVDSGGGWRQYVYHYTPMTGALRKIGYDALDMLMLSHPEGVAIGPGDSVVVADSGAHRVCVFTAHGNLARAFGSQGDGDGQLSYPKGVCVDARDNVFVADCNNHRVSLYDKRGEFVRHVLTAAEHGLRYPRGVALNAATGSLLVTQEAECLLFQL